MSLKSLLFSIFLWKTEKSLFSFFKCYNTSWCNCTYVFCTSLFLFSNGPPCIYRIKTGQSVFRTFGQYILHEIKGLMNSVKSELWAFLKACTCVKVDNLGISNMSLNVKGLPITVKGSRLRVQHREPYFI